MEETIIISREEYMELIKLKTRVEVLTDFLASDCYASKDEICAILGIEVEKNG